MPAGETLENFARTGATLAVHLSVNNLKTVVDELSPHYGADCPVAVVYRATWPDEAVITGVLSDIRAKVKNSGFTRTALILVGPALGAEDFTDSKLYDASHSHVLHDAKTARS
jgi:precorrin-4/cobalt-precorrin-4 C11-methyltransferase